MRIFILSLLLSVASFAQVAQPSKSVDVVILAGTSLSKVVDMHVCVPLALVLPTNMAPAANFTLQSSVNGTDFTNVYDAYNSEMTIQTGTGTARTIVVSAGDFYFARYLKFRMGTAGSPTNTTANFNFTVTCK